MNFAMKTVPAAAAAAAEHDEVMGSFSFQV